MWGLLLGSLFVGMAVVRVRRVATRVREEEKSILRMWLDGWCFFVLGRQDGDGAADQLSLSLCSVLPCFAYFRSRLFLFCLAYQE